MSGWIQDAELADYLLHGPATEDVDIVRVAEGPREAEVAAVEALDR